MAYHRYKHQRGSYYRGRSRSGRYYTRKGCYIATCIYGSYDCPQVWTLRRFRDDILADKWYGRLFIQIYYMVSPWLVKLMGNTGIFQNFWRRRLDYLVEKLEEKGISNKPYEDK